MNKRELQARARVASLSDTDELELMTEFNLEVVPVYDKGRETINSKSRRLCWGAGMVTPGIGILNQHWVLGLTPREAIRKAVKVLTLTEPRSVEDVIADGEAVKAAARKLNKPGKKRNV